MCMGAHMFMVKNIAIMDTVYRELTHHKRPGESFSKEIMRLLENKSRISDLAGTWKMTEREADRLKKDLKSFRSLSTKKIFHSVAGLEVIPY